MVTAVVAAYTNSIERGYYRQQGDDNGWKHSVDNDGH